MSRISLLGALALAVAGVGCAANPPPHFYGAAAPPAPTSSAAPASPPAPGKVVSGRLAPEIIQRTVRKNFGRFRLCYENGLRIDPTLTGRVMVRFVIGRDGRVPTVSDGGSDIPDKEVVSCTLRGFKDLVFPEPDGGIVTVTYPIMFSSSAPMDDGRTPAPPGFFAGCGVGDLKQGGGLNVVCPNGTVGVYDVPASLAPELAAKSLAEFEASYPTASRHDRTTTMLGGRTRWATVIQLPSGGRATQVLIPLGPNQTRVANCIQGAAKGSSEFCDRVIAIFERGGAPKDLLSTP